MLNDKTVASMRAALNGLAAPEGCGTWSAIAPMGALAADLDRVVIDFKASDAVGAPVILAYPKSPREGLLDRLTPARRRVAELMIAGKSNKEIARLLDITPGTVKDHVHSILTSLGLPNRRTLMVAATGG